MEKNPSVAVPSSLMIEITSECNLHCKQCYLWMEKDPPESLSTAEKVDLVKQYGQWAGMRGSLFLLGGEPFRKPLELFSLCQTAKEFGISTLVVSNGTMISPELFHQVLTEGPRYLFFSLDAPNAEVHDWIRGTNGAFAKVTETIRTLCAYRDQHFPHAPRSIFVNSIVCKATLPHLLENIRFVKELGADGITFNALSKTVLNSKKDDPFFEEQRQVNLPLLDETVNRILAMLGWSSPSFEIATGKIDLEWMKQYFRNPFSETEEGVCVSTKRNLIVNKFGDVSLCNFQWEHFGHNLGNVRNQPLIELWNGARARELRDEMSSCRKSCGMLHCHRKGVEIK